MATSSFRSTQSLDIEDYNNHYSGQDAEVNAFFFEDVHVAYVDLGHNNSILDTTVIHYLHY